MNNIKKPLILLFLLVSLFACQVGGESSKYKMRNISAQELTADMGIGWNLGNTLDAHNGQLLGVESEMLWHKPTTTRAMIEVVKAQGFNTIRIPITWYSHLGKSPEYKIDEAWMNRVEEIINYALDCDMYVILNTHHEEGHWLLPRYANEAEASQQLTAIWEQIAHRFKPYGDHLLFETINEPRVQGSTYEWDGGTTEGREMVNTFNKVALDAIRASGGHNKKRFVLCPTYAASSKASAVKDYVVPNDDARVIVAIHSYFPFNFCQNTKREGATPEWGTEADIEALAAEMQMLDDRFVAQGHAVVMGEWGSLDKSNTEARAVHAAHYVRLALAHGIVPVVWDDGGKFQLLQRETLTWKYPAIVDSIINQTR